MSKYFDITKRHFSLLNYFKNYLITLLLNEWINYPFYITIGIFLCDAYQNEVEFHHKSMVMVSCLSDQPNLSRVGDTKSPQKKTLWWLLSVWVPNDFISIAFRVQNKQVAANSSNASCVPVFSDGSTMVTVTMRFASMFSNIKYRCEGGATHATGL